MQFLTALRKKTKASKYELAAALNMAWGNYARAERQGVSIRCDHLWKAWEFARAKGVSAETFLSWIKLDHDEIAEHKHRGRKATDNAP